MTSVSAMLILLLSAFAALRHRMAVRTAPDVLSNITSPSSTSTVPFIEDGEASWPIYRDDQFGFSFQHPPSPEWEPRRASKDDAGNFPEKVWGELTIWLGARKHFINVISRSASAARPEDNSDAAGWWPVGPAEWDTQLELIEANKNVTKAEVDCPAGQNGDVEPLCAVEKIGNVSYLIFYAAPPITYYSEAQKVYVTYHRGFRYAFYVPPPPVTSYYFGSSAWQKALARPRANLISYDDAWKNYLDKFERDNNEARVFREMIESAMFF